jgi:hypothetical protein
VEFRPFHEQSLLSGMRGVTSRRLFYYSLGKSGFLLDRAEKLARFVGQGLVILTTCVRAGEKADDDLNHRKRSLVFIQWHIFIFLPVVFQSSTKCSSHFLPSQPSLDRPLGVLASRDPAAQDREAEERDQDGGVGLPTL